MANRVMEADIEQEEIQQDQYLVFGIDSQEFGLRAIRVQGISAALGTTKVPTAQRYVEGILNHRGQLATVISFRKKFEYEPKEHDEDTRTIMVEMGGFPIGIVVDRVEEVISIPNERVQQLPASSSLSAPEECIAGVGMLDDRLIVLLDVDKVLTETESMETGALRRAIDDAQTTEGPAEAEGTQIDAAHPSDMGEATVESEGR